MAEARELGIKDFDTMVSDTLQKIVDSKVGITNTMVGSVVRTLTEAILDNVDATNYYAEYIYNAMSIDTATGEDLDRLVAIFGIVRNRATKATGIVTFDTGDAPYKYDIIIPYGYEVTTKQLSDGTINIFKVNESGAILRAGDTEIDVEVICTEPGHKYLPAGALCVMSRSIVGIASVINHNEINSGLDEETDDELRKRVKEFLQSFGKCTETALRSAVNNIDGINNCTVIDLYEGNGTAGIIVVPMILPVLDRIREEVESVVKDTKAAGIKVFIIYPDIKFIDISIEVKNDEGHDDLILQAISNYVNSLYAGQTFIVRQMERKILNILDDNDIENDDIDISTVIPDENIGCGREEIIRVSKISINGVEYDV